MKVVSRLSSVLLCLVACSFFGGKATATTGADGSPPVVSLCDILRQPSDYAGKTVVVAVHITAMKEVTSLWSPDCSKLGVSLLIEESPDSGLAALRGELRKYGLSARPVLATLTGIYVADYFDEIRHRRRAVFKATAAKDIKRSPKAESR